MEKLISCAFNMDTACVELRFSDRNICSIDTIAVVISQNLVGQHPRPFNNFKEIGCAPSALNVKKQLSMI